MAANKRLNATITIGGAISPTLKSAFGTTTDKLKGVTAEIGSLMRAQKNLSNAIQVFGRMGKNVDGLRQKYAATIVTVDRLRAAQKRMTDTQARAERINAATGFKPEAPTMKGVGTGMTVAGGVMLASVRPMVTSAMQRENEVNIIKNSGLSAVDQGGLIAAAKGSKQFGVSITDAFKTARELQASLGSAHHAIEALPTALKAKSGLQLYNREHQGHEVDDDAMYSLAKIADERGGATSADAMRTQMNLAFKAITASQGKVSAGDWLNAQRGAKAAGVGMNSNAFFGDAFMVQALGAPQYGKALSTLNNAWIGGHQDAHKFTNMLSDGLLDRTKAKTKNGLVTGYKSDALVDSKLFIQDQQAWAEKYLVPLAKRKGVNLQDPSAVQKFAADYTSNTNAGNVLFQRLFNRTAIDRDRKNYLGAPGIDASDKQNQESSAGKQADAQARLNDAMTDFGTNVLPLYTKALTAASNTLKGFNEFADKHGTLVKAMGVGIVGLGAVFTVLGPIVTLAGAGMSAYAAVQLRAAAASAAAAAGIATETNAIRAQNAAVGGGLAAFAKRAALVLAIANVADAAAGQLGVGKDKASQAQDDKNWNRFTAAGKTWSGIWRGAEHVGRFIGMTNIADAAQADRVKGETDYLNGQGGVAPVPPMATARGAGGQTVHDNSQVTIQVVQQPGQSGDDLSKTIARVIREQQGVRNRSIMYDQANP